MMARSLSALPSPSLTGLIARRTRKLYAEVGLSLGLCMVCVCVCLCVYINTQPATCHSKSETLAGFAGPVDPANLDTQPVDIMTLFPLLEQKQHQFATDAPEQEARRQAAKASVCAG